MWLRHFQSDSSTDNFPRSTAPITFSCTSQSNLNNTSFINTLQQLSSGESVPDTCTCANINIHLIPVPLTMTWYTLWGTCPCSYRKQHFEWFNSLIVSAFFLISRMKIFPFRLKIMSFQLSPRHPNTQSYPYTSGPQPFLFSYHSTLRSHPTNM